MDKLNYSSETVNRYILECIDALDTAKEKGAQFVEMDPLVALKGFTDLGNAHLMLAEAAKHTCKSRFGVGVVLGLSTGFVISEFIINKQKARWWKGFEEGRAAGHSE